MKRETGRKKQTHQETVFFFRSEMFSFLSIYFFSVLHSNVLKMDLAILISYWLLVSCVFWWYVSPRGRIAWGLMGVLYFVFIILTVDKTGKILIKVSHWVETYQKLYNLCLFCFYYLFVKILSIKPKNALLLNIGRVSLINFVTINLLGGFSWFFLGIKVKAFIKANTKYANLY